VVYSVILGNSSQNSKRSLQLLNAICTARIYSQYKLLCAHESARMPRN